MALNTVDSRLIMSNAPKLIELPQKRPQVISLEKPVTICNIPTHLLECRNSSGEQQRKEVKVTVKYLNLGTDVAPLDQSQKFILNRGINCLQMQVNSTQSNQESLTIPEACNEVTVNSVLPETENLGQLATSTRQANFDASKMKKENEIEKNNQMEKTTADAFRFLRQTSSGRIVKRTELASGNLKDYWVDVPMKSKNNSSPPKPTNDTCCQHKVNNHVTTNKQTENLISTEKQKQRTDLCKTDEQEVKSNSKKRKFQLCNNLLTEESRSEIKNERENCENEDEESKSVEDESNSSKSTRAMENPCVKTEPTESDSITENGTGNDTEQISRIHEDNANCLFRVKLDHDYDQKKPSNNDQDVNERYKVALNQEQNEDEVNENESVDIKPEISTFATNSQEITAAELHVVAIKQELQEEKSIAKRGEKKDEIGRNRKKVRLSSEVRTLIDESIKLTKTSSVTSALKTRKTRVLRNKKKRTECEMLLDMLSETPGPEKLIRVKGRNAVTFSSPSQLKNVTKISKIKVKDEKLTPNENKTNAVRKGYETPPKSQTNVNCSKKNMTPLVVQKKKAIRMKLNLEKKKKEKMSKACESASRYEGNPSSIKMIVLEDLKEKMKAKMEQSTCQKRFNSSINEWNDVTSPTTSPLTLTSIPLPFDSRCSTSDLNVRRPPGRPRIHHFPPPPKPAKISRHGKILGRPRKCSITVKERPLLPSGTVQVIQNVSAIHKTSSASTNNAQSLVGQSFVLRVPVISLAPTALSTNYSFPISSIESKSELTIKKNPAVEYRDYSRQRSSQRQAENSFRYKEIAVKSHADFVQIILVANTRPKNGLNPQIFNELKTAMLVAKKDSKCKVVLIHGTGSMFCSGVDLTYLIRDNKEQRQKMATEMVASMRDFINLMISFPKPVVVAVNGCAVGLGVGLLLLCDVIYASDKATFSMPYSRLGQVPEGCASCTLPKSISMSMVNELLLGGRRLTATEAFECGLISQVFWPNDLLEEVIPRVQKMATQNGHVMETTKALLRQRMKADLEATLENECQLLFSQWCQLECQNAMKEFVDQIDQLV